MTAASADLRQLAQDLRAATGTPLDMAAAEVVRRAAVRVQASAMQFAPVATGALKNSITIRFDTPTSATIGPGVEYGPYQEFGTGSRGEFPGAPYEIRPKNASALSFTVDGKRVVTQKVVHPGVRAKRYMRRAVKEALEPLTADLAATGALLITKGPNA